MTREALMQALHQALVAGLAGQAQVRRTAGTSDAGERDLPQVCLLEGSDEPDGDDRAGAGAPLGLLACPQIEAVCRGTADAVPTAINGLYAAVWQRFASGLPRGRKVQFRGCEFIEPDADRAGRFRLAVGIPYTARF